MVLVGSWRLLGHALPGLKGSWVAPRGSWGSVGSVLGGLGGAACSLARWLPGFMAPGGRIQAPEAQTARDCSHRAFPGGGGARTLDPRLPP